MLKWSEYFQNPDFLERTRLELVVPEYGPLIHKWCGLKNNSRVLDVGCGTGFFTRFLKHAGSGVRATGLDLDEDFLERARYEAKRENLDITFVQGNALSLPFEDGSFDVVASHTFFTNAPEPEKVLSEMKRVLSPGGRVASLTAMRIMPEIFNWGHYPIGCIMVWSKELIDLSQKLFAAYEKIAPISSFVTGLNPAVIPNFFASHGLKNVCAYPIGKVFSLSNAATSPEIKERWLKFYELSEEKKLAAFMKLPEMKDLFSEEEAKRYMELVRMKCAYYRANPDENEIWETVGSSNLLVTGDI